MPIKKEKIKEKRKTNLNFQISEILRSKLHKMLKGKYTSRQKLIGCDIEHLKRWIEYRFDEYMTWDNLGKYWHIDHILPINKFNFTNLNEQQICFHWTNLQPLKASENIKKSKSITKLYKKLKFINLKLWKIEDDIRDCERKKNFGDKFIKLARAVYFTNDERSLVKNKINKLTKSNISEVKSYKKY